MRFPVRTVCQKMSVATTEHRIQCKWNPEKSNARHTWLFECLPRPEGLSRGSKASNFHIVHVLENVCLFISLCRHGMAWHALAALCMYLLAILPQGKKFIEIDFLFRSFLVAVHIPQSHICSCSQRSSPMGFSSELKTNAQCASSKSITRLQNCKFNFCFYRRPYVNVCPVPVPGCCLQSSTLQCENMYFFR